MHVPFAIAVPASGKSRKIEPFGPHETLPPGAGGCYFAELGNFCNKDVPQIPYGSSGTEMGV
jgi:hypothetical protein